MAARGVRAAAREPNGGLMVLPDISMTNYREAIIALAARQRVPAVYPFRYFAASGGLMVLRHRRDRGVLARSRLCRPHPQRRKARRFAGASSD